MDMKKFLAQEVKPAFGCTEPAAAAFAAAHAAGALQNPVTSLAIEMSVPFSKMDDPSGFPAWTG